MKCQMSQTAAQLKRNGTSIYQSTHTHPSTHTQKKQFRAQSWAESVQMTQRCDNDKFSVGVHKQLSLAQPSTTQHRNQKKKSDVDTREKGEERMKEGRRRIGATDTQTGKLAEYSESNKAMTPQPKEQQK